MTHEAPDYVVAETLDCDAGVMLMATVTDPIEPTGPAVAIVKLTDVVETR